VYSHAAWYVGADHHGGECGEDVQRHGVEAGLGRGAVGPDTGTHDPPPELHLHLPHPHTGRVTCTK